MSKVARDYLKAESLIAENTGFPYIVRQLKNGTVLPEGQLYL